MEEHEMNMPSFSAEASLYKTSGHYQGSANGGSLAPRSTSANEVQAAAAIYVDGRFICNGEVTSNGFINCFPVGGGGGGDSCRPGCSLCRNVPGVGRRKSCVTRNCDVREVRC
jgi:hypothetical protein